jgi:hypothetical protein
MPITFSVAIAAALLGLPDTPAAEPNDSAKTLRVIAQKTEQNQQTFANFVCRFRVAQGMTPSIASAQQEVLVPPKFTAEATWAVKGAVSTFELITPKDSLDKAVQLARSNGETNSVALPFMDMKFIENGRQRWLYSYWAAPGFGLIKRVSNQFTQFRNPFNTCLEHEHQGKSAAELIRLGLDRGSVRLLPPDPADTANIHRVEFVEDAVVKERVQVVTLMKFDADRGYLPTEVSVGISGKPIAVKTIVVSAVRAANGAWYPQRTLEFEHPETISRNFRFQECVVTEMRLSVEPDDLRITIPAGTAIQDGATVGDAPVLEADTVLTPETLVNLKSGTKSSTIRFLKSKVADDADKTPR